MTGASKILTVSYGTFSCTLEGFDDPFSTMKAIAEYFRDLAADDRYFGAEPPTPDAAMLHRIAEREIQRRVEAKIQENGVVLRAAEGVGQGQNATITMPATMPAASALSMQRPAFDAAPAVVDGDKTDAAEDSEEAGPLPALATLGAPEAGRESVAEKLSRLRADSASQTAAQAVTLSVPLPDPSPVAEDAGAAADMVEPLVHADDPTDTLLADLMADFGGAAPAQASVGAALATSPLDLSTADIPTAEEIVTPAVEPAQDVDLSSLVDSAEATQVEALDAPLIDAAMADDRALALDAVEDWQPEETVAQDLSAQETETDADLPTDLSDDALLAALVQANPAAAEAAPETVAVELTETADDQPLEFTATDADLMTDAEADAADLAALTAGVSDDQPAFPEADDSLFADTLSADAQFEADLAAALDSADLAEKVAADPAPDADPIESIFADSDDVTDQDPLPAILSTAPEAFDLPAELPSKLPTEEVAPATPAPLAASGDEPEEGEPLPGVRAEAAEKLQRARARVIRIRGRDAAAAAGVADAPTVTDNETAVATPAPTQPIVEAPILSPQDEAELEAELAALRAESAPAAAHPAPEAAISPPAETPAVTGMPAASMEQAEPRRAFSEEAADAAVTRLMAQADEVMEGPDNKRRLSAIAHLKAAVAATVADRNAGAELPSEQPSRLARYRDDLAMVVRAKLGVGPATGERPAPLVLVSEQRVDRAPTPTPTRTPAPVAAPQAAVPAPVAVPAPAPAPAAVEAGPIRPRRIVPAAMTAAPADEDEEEDTVDTSLVDARGFSEFADRLGARTLPEMIEASAAYLAIVQKRDAFSRPQLMANVAAAMPGDLPREDGLRSFGALLRSGRLSKLRRGQFVLSQQSNYLTEGKRIAG